MIDVGQQAPDFNLADDDGQRLARAALLGGPVVLYFYPKDDTSGCTAEAEDFTRLAKDFAASGVAVIGISPDSVESHRKFKAKHGLTVRLASDPETSVSEAYGVWVKKSMYGRTYMGVERTTFLIDGTGTIAKVWRKVKVRGHADEVLAAARALAEKA